MLKQNYSELPASNIINKKNEAKKLQLFNHYINHTHKDIPNSKSNSSKKVIESIIKKFSHKYQPEKYFRSTASSVKSINENLIDESIEDIRSVAHLAVWEAAHKYVWGITKKINKKIVNVNYEDKFFFCQFASQQVKFKLQTYLRKKNLDRVCGHVPETDDVKKIYVLLPKIKFSKGNIDRKDYESLAKKTKSLSAENIQKLDRLITCKVISGDEEKNGDEGSSTNNWDYLTSDKNKKENFASNELVIDNTEEIVCKNINTKNFYNLISFYLNKLSNRDSNILLNTKFSEISNLKKIYTQAELGKKYNISGEAIRKISEKKFKEFEIFIKKNKKKLGR